MSLNNSKNNKLRHAAWMLAMWCSLSSAAELKQINIRVQNQQTTIQISLDRPASYDVFLLNQPQRLVLDLKEVAVRPLTCAIPQQALVKKIRTGQHKQAFRLVFELTQPVLWTSVRAMEAGQAVLNLNMRALGVADAQRASGRDEQFDVHHRMWAKPVSGSGAPVEPSKESTPVTSASQIPSIPSKR